MDNSEFRVQTFRFLSDFYKDTSQIRARLHFGQHAGKTDGATGSPAYYSLAHKCTKGALIPAEAGANLSTRRNERLSWPE